MVLRLKLFLLCVTLTLQAQGQRLSFDLASVHEAKAGSRPGGEEAETNVPLGPGNVYSPTGGQLNARNVPLIQLVSFAYRMTGSQQSAFSEMAPAWAREVRYDVKARTDKADVTKDELRLMVRSLLAERFSLAVHYETRTMAVYSMQFVKPATPGPRLRPHEGGSCSKDFQNNSPDLPQPEATEDGYPTVCGGLLLLPSSTAMHYRIGARDIPINTVATSLTSWGDLGRPVVNETGFSGNVDFTLDFIPRRVETGAGTEGEEPNFLEALRKQLGVKLESEKKPVQVLILDRIEHLTDN